MTALLGRLLLTLACLATPAAPGAADDEGFRPLFDGRTLDGWVRFGGKPDDHVEDEKE